MKQKGTKQNEQNERNETRKDKIGKKHTHMEKKTRESNTC